ncbi:MAG: hypothetical protein OXG95_09215 [Chloroflexi bacterium]|nr:hypothetical protein [Chloroflexota bacterium]
MNVLSAMRACGLAVAVAALAMGALASACTGGDDEAEPTPTATRSPTTAATATPATPTATPTPAPTPTTAATPTSTPAPSPSPDPTASPTPAPAAATATPEPTLAPTLKDFVLTQTTTGKDLLDRLSEKERECIKEAFGEFIYAAMQGLPLLAAGSEPSQAAPLFACLETESVVRAGVAFLAVPLGGWDAETRECAVQVGLKNPEAILSSFGLPSREDPNAAAEANPYIVELYDCLPAEDQVDYLLSLVAAIDALSSAGRDLIGAIPQADVACIRDALSDGEYARLLAGTVGEAFDVAEAVSGCISDEAYVQAYMSMSEAALGELSDDSRSCLEEFARDHPRYTALMDPQAYDASSDRERLAEVATDGIKTWLCLTPDEIERSQAIAIGAMSR